MSASAQMWASTRNETLRKKMSAVVSVLSDCQVIIGTGYLSAFPSDFFERVEALKPVWAPYYTIHKVDASINTCNRYGKSNLLYPHSHL